MHVVFDLDGVLLDSESDLSWLDRGLDAALSECGLAATAENRSRLFPPTRERLAELAAAAGVSVETCWEIRNRHYTEAKLAAIEAGRIGAYPDVAVVAEMAAEHPLAIVSNSPQAVVDAFVERAGLADTFERTVGRGETLSDVERLKPHPHLYERLHAETAADEYVYVGDEDSDREFARATGMAFVHLDRERGPIDSLAAVRERVAALARGEPFNVPGGKRATMPESAFETTVPIRYADFDTLGHVNNAVYATILEEARIAYYRSVLDLDVAAESLVVVHLDIDFERPLESGPATVRVDVPEVGTTSFTMDYEVFADGERVATARTVMATLDPETGRARRVPDTWRRAFDDAG